MITRREFVAGITALGAGAALSAAAPSRIEVGLELYSLRQKMAVDVPGTLAQVRAMGFAEVEVPGYYGLSPVDFRQALNTAGLKAKVLVAQWDALENSIAAVKSGLATLGAQWAVLPWIPHEGPFTRSSAEHAAAKMNRWGAALADAGYRFAYHPHGYEFQPAPEGTLFDVLAAATDPALVKFEMDTFWIAWPGQDCVQLLKRYPQRFRLLHLKDLSRSAGPGNLSGSAPEADSVAIGDGVLHWPELLRVAREQGCEGYYIEDESPDAATQIPRSLRYLAALHLYSGSPIAVHRKHNA